MNAIVFKCMDDTIDTVISQEIFMSNKKPDYKKIKDVDTVFILSQKDVFNEVKLFAIAKYQPNREANSNDKAKFKNSSKHAWNFSFDLDGLVTLNNGQGYTITECFTKEAVDNIKSTQVFNYINTTDYLDDFLQNLKNELERLNRYDLTANLPRTLWEQKILRQVKLAENSLSRKYKEGDIVEIQIRPNKKITFTIVKIIPEIKDGYLMNEKWEVKLSTGETKFYDAKTVEGLF